MRSPYVVCRRIYLVYSVLVQVSSFVKYGAAAAAAKRISKRVVTKGYVGPYIDRFQNSILYYQSLRAYLQSMRLLRLVVVRVSSRVRFREVIDPPRRLFGPSYLPDFESRTFYLRVPLPMTTTYGVYIPCPRIASVHQCLSQATVFVRPHSVGWLRACSSFEDFFSM